jgi:type IV pilus assembly protein PilA
MSTSNTSTTALHKNQSGFSLIELLIVVAIILVIAAIAIPNMLASKRAANQASAVASLRTISSASASYLTAYGDGFAGSLDLLGGDQAAAASCNSALLLDPTFSSAPYQKSGYQFSYSGQGGNVTTTPPGCANPGFNGYLSTTVPLAVGTTGNISYCNSEDGAIHMDVNGAAIASQSACAALQGE